MVGRWGKAFVDGAELVLFFITVCSLVSKLLFRNIVKEFRNSFNRTATQFPNHF